MKIFACLGGCCEDEYNPAEMRDSQSLSQKQSPEEELSTMLRIPLQMATKLLQKTGGDMTESIRSVKSFDLG